MPKYIKTKSGRKIELNTPKEEAKINAGIAADPEARELSDAELENMVPFYEHSDTPTEFKEAVKKEAAQRIGRPPVDTHKIPTSIRLSENVVGYFRATGKGWQTRIDEVLKQYVSRH